MSLATTRRTVDKQGIESLASRILGHTLTYAARQAVGKAFDKIVKRLLAIQLRIKVAHHVRSLSRHFATRTLGSSERSGPLHDILLGNDRHAIHQTSILAKHAEEREIDYAPVIVFEILIEVLTGHTDSHLPGLLIIGFEPYRLKPCGKLRLIQTRVYKFEATLPKSLSINHCKSYLSFLPNTEK